MATYTFIKKAGAPAGTIHVTVANTAFLIDDASNPSITTTDPDIYNGLAQVGYLQLNSVVGTPYVPPPASGAGLSAARSTDGTGGLSAPTNSGVELVFTAQGLDSILLNGVPQ